MKTQVVYLDQQEMAKKPGTKTFVVKVRDYAWNIYYVEFASIEQALCWCREYDDMLSEWRIGRRRDGVWLVQSVADDRKDLI